MSKMSPADESFYGNDNRIDVQTNLDFDIFKSSSFQAFSEKIDQTVSIAARGEKIYLHHKKQNTRIVAPLLKVQNVPVLLLTNYQY